MEYRSLEINVISAKDLKKVNLIGKTHAYAVVSISGDPRASQQQRTAVDRSGNASATWNFPVKFAVNKSAARGNRLAVTFRIRCERSLGDKDIGEVNVPLSELIGSVEDGELWHTLTYQVRRPSGKPNKGELNFSYKWGPVAAYPAQVGPSPVSPPPPTCYWYPPPQPGYAYPPPPPGYGYNPVQQPQKNNWFAKLLGVELVKVCLGYAITDGFGLDPGVL